MPAVRCARARARKIPSPRRRTAVFFQGREDSYAQLCFCARVRVWYSPPLAEDLGEVARAVAAKVAYVKAANLATGYAIC